MMQEMVHLIKIKKGKVGFIAIKLDLEKVYDRLDWKFIVDILTDIGVLEKLINLIWHCISLVSMQVLWNGSLTSSFTSSHGVR